MVAVLLSGGLGAGWWWTNHLDRMRPGDMIGVWTARGRFDYRVTGGGVTLPVDTSVSWPAAAHGAAILTLTTCNPEFSARERLYVHAVLTRSTGYPGPS